MDDTIIAIATPPGRSLRAIIRLSGNKSIPLSKKAFIPENKSAFSRTQISISGNVIIPDKKLKLPARLYIMKAPRSYTREDVVEIHTLGSPPLLDILLKYFIKKGARLAQPGEFTKRAFLNGRIDLAQAESVLNIIKSGSRHELNLFNRLLQGSFSEKVARIENSTKDLLIQTELSLDFSDQDVSIITDNQIRTRLQTLIKEISGFLKTRSETDVFKERISIAICGAPNAGKSSLFNKLIGKNKAIVTPVPGTTRDAIESEFNMHGRKLSLFDTAGIGIAEKRSHNTGSDIRKISLLKTMEAVTNADFFLFVIDGSRKTTNNDLTLPDKASPKRTIVVVNKSDLPNKTDLTKVKTLLKYPFAICRVSALNGTGVKELKNKLHEMIHQLEADKSASPNTINNRIRTSLTNALTSLKKAIKNKSIELIAFELREALNEFGNITGATTPDDVLNQIFSGFCIGK